ncbi:hypothetical protein NWP09_12540, partial [Agrococcus sp. HG114]|nr:hypothetical protein [Agrococcus sp. HG114]
AGAPRPHAATAIGAALATAAALAVVAVMVACWFALESLGVAPTEWLLVGAGAVLALAAGALAGRAWWPRAAARTLARPRASA